jgi:hypothetical protein
MTITGQLWLPIVLDGERHYEQRCNLLCNRQRASRTGVGLVATVEQQYRIVEHVSSHHSVAYHPIPSHPPRFDSVTTLDVHMDHKGPFLRHLRSLNSARVL